MWSIPVPEFFLHISFLPLNWAVITLGLVFIYYVILSVSLAMGMFLFGLFCLAVCQYISGQIEFPLWKISLIVFIVAWIGQFLGHKVEGKKPSFFKDLQFLMIGPAWLMSFIYKRIGLKY